MNRKLPFEKFGKFGLIRLVGSQGREVGKTGGGRERRRAVAGETECSKMAIFVMSHITRDVNAVA